jgi:hypothetical protein
MQYAGFRALCAGHGRKRSFAHISPRSGGKVVEEISQGDEAIRSSIKLL